VARYHRLLSILIADGLVFCGRQLVSHTAVRCGLNWSTYCVQPLAPAQHREMSGTQISYSQRSLVNRGQRKLRIVQSQRKRESCWINLVFTESGLASTHFDTRLKLLVASLGTRSLSTTSWATSTSLSRIIQARSASEVDYGYFPRLAIQASMHDVLGKVSVTCCCGECYVECSQVYE